MLMAETRLAETFCRTVGVLPSLKKKRFGALWWRNLIKGESIRD
jgi:hypothetical protein